MRTVLRISRIAISSVCIAAALLFAGIEAYALFSGNWLLHEQPLLGASQYLFRFIIAVLGILASVGVLRCRKHALTGCLCTAAACVSTSPLIPNEPGIILPVLACLSVTICLFSLTDNQIN